MPLNGKYVKIERVLEAIHRDFRFNTDIDWVDIIEWVGDCLSLIGAPQTFVEKVTDGNTDLYHPCPIEIENYRGKLPYDIYEVIQCRKGGSNKEPMRRSTDTYHSAYFCNGSPDNSCQSDYTYKINNSFIFTSFKKGTVEMAYRAYPADERGYPLIPDNQKFIEACKWFIADKIAFRLVLQNRMDGAVYQKIEQEKLWYIGAADTAARIPTYDKAEGWKNMFIRLIPDVRAHGIGFRGIGDMEQRYNSTYDQ